MVKKNLHTDSFLFCKIEFTLILFLLCFLGCKKKVASNAEEEAKYEVFAKKLPHNNPDSCIKMIKKVEGFSPQNVSNFCLNIIYKAFDGQSSETYLKHLDNFEAFRGKEDPHLKGVIQIHRGLKYKEMGLYDTALVFLNDAKNIFIQRNDSPYIAQTLRRMVEVYSAQNRYVASTSSCLEMLSYLGKKKDLEWEYAMTGMTLCYMNQQKYQKAKELTWENIKASEVRGDLPFHSFKYIGLSKAYFALNQLDSALWAIHISDSLAKKSNYVECIDVTNATFGMIWRQKGDFEKGLSYSQQALRMFDSLGKRDFRVATYNDVGHCYLMSGQWEKAEKIYLENLQEVKKLKKKNIEIITYDSLVSLHLKKEGNYKVWNYLKRSQKLRDSLWRVEKMYMMDDLNVSYEAAEGDKRMKELAIDKKLFRLLAVIAILLLLIAICVIIWGIYFNRQKRLILLQENQLLAAKEQLHLQEIETKEQLHALELNLYKEQLENFKQNIYQKNQVIIELDKRVSLLLPSNVEMEKEHERNKELLMEARILTEGDWKNYLSFFEKVHEGFIERVNTQFSDLTPAELRLFLLLKQEADRKEIANILGVSPNTVKKSRQRLRKKLGLIESEDLEQFILQF
jgi:tetratricopeptide (TPR) repeat protein